jgi:hypothetical protein
MRSISYTVIIAILGICNASEGMFESSSPCISYQSARGTLVKERLVDVNESTFQNMSADSFKQMSYLVQRYQQFVARSTFSLKKADGLAQISSLRSSIISDEFLFLVGTEIDSTFLQKGYSKLANICSDDVALTKFDDNLRAIYANSSNSNLCRKLAEACKELALSSEQKEDFIKAAFWFRMLYATGEHSSYLQEYENMCYKAGVK